MELLPGQFVIISGESSRLPLLFSQCEEHICTLQDGQVQKMGCQPTVCIKKTKTVSLTNIFVATAFWDRQDPMEQVKTITDKYYVSLLNRKKTAKYPKPLTIKSISSSL